MYIYTEKLENKKLPVCLEASQAHSPLVFSSFCLRGNYCSCISDFYPQVPLYTLF